MGCEANGNVKVGWWGVWGETVVLMGCDWWSNRLAGEARREVGVLVRGEQGGGEDEGRAQRVANCQLPVAIMQFL